MVQLLILNRDIEILALISTYTTFQHQPMIHGTPGTIISPGRRIVPLCCRDNDTRSLTYVFKNI